MAIKFTSTKEATGKYVKCLVYGNSGIGKTMLASTAPSPIIISSESGLLSLQDFDIPVIMVENHLDLKQALDFVKTSPKAEKFETVVLDSLSDIAESCLDYFRKNPENNNTNPQAAYGLLADKLLPLIKGFRDIPNKNVYFIAKITVMADEYTGINKYAPMMPGRVLPNALPYLFDLVMPMRSAKNDKGDIVRFLQTVEDPQYIAKDRSRRLSQTEPANLSVIFEKAVNNSLAEDEGGDAEEDLKDDVEDSVEESEEDNTEE